MRFFFSYLIDDQQLVLEGEEAKHCTKVMRKKVGDLIYVLDGRGHKYSATISDLRRNSCIADIIKKEVMPKAKTWNMTVAISPIKNSGRLEWFVEKATEMGIDRIVPILCKRTEKPSIRRNRMINILISAMKQSGQYWLPRLDDVVSLEDFLLSEKESQPQKFIAYCGAELQDLAQAINSDRDVCVLIGPEGGFTSEEYDFATANGFSGVSLGHNRLRTETAGMVACASAHIINTITR